MNSASASASALASVSLLENPLNQLEARCANFLEGFREGESPPIDDAVVAANEIYTVCLPVLITLSSLESAIRPLSGSVSSETFDSDYSESPDSAPRRFSFSSPSLSPLKNSVELLSKISGDFQSERAVKESSTSKPLVVSAKQAIDVIREILIDIKFLERDYFSKTASSKTFCTASAAAPAAAPCILPKAVIAICDDERPCRRILEEKYLPDFATGSIFLTESITSLRELLERSGAEINLLFLDNILKDGTGLAFIKEIRAHPIWSKIFVILLTGDGTLNLSDELEPTKPMWLAKRFDGYLTKPTSKKVIRETLEANFLRIQSSTDPLEERNWTKK